jgi:RNA polymerase sigma-70 factor (ECF subfamily)
LAKREIGVSQAQPRRIEGYLGRLFGYAFSLTNDREQSRDLVQDCAVKALSAHRVPIDEAAYRAWLFRILRNTFLDRLRRVNGVSYLGDEEPRDERDGPGDIDDRMVSVLTVRLGMAKLAPAHRDVIAVVDILGLSYAEAAELLEVPVGTVMSRLSRARRALLEIINESNVQPLPLQQKRAMK